MKPSSGVIPHHWPSQVASRPRGSSVSAHDLPRAGCWPGRLRSFGLRRRGEDDRHADSCPGTQGCRLPEPVRHLRQGAASEAGSENPSARTRAYPLDSETILVRGYSNPLTMPLTAVRLPSAKIAARRIQNDRPLLTGRLPRRLLPHGYDVKFLSETQVCNVVLTSYNLS